MEEGLVDDFVLLYSPIVLGKGKKLFAAPDAKHTLQVAESTVLGGGMLAVRMNAAAASGFVPRARRPLRGLTSTAAR